MNTPKTPGPWKATRFKPLVGSSDYWAIHRADDPSPSAHAIAEVDDDCAEAKADARLIAAAPDMLAALKAVQAWQYDDAMSDDEALNLVAEAIAQAEAEAERSQP